MKEHTESIAVSAHGDEGHGDQSVLNPDASMLVLTWITFFLLLAVLYKFAWKPILTALDAREASIKKSVEDAERIQKELEQLDEKSQEIITKAERKSQAIIDQAKKGAVEAAKSIEKKARDESQIILENAKREINEEMKKVQAQLRGESAQIAVKIAEKLLQENLTDQKNQKLVNRLIKEM